MLQDFIGGAKGILVVVGLAALLALAGYILFDFDARTPTFSSAVSTDE
jgi:hypothetical protein